MRTLTLSVFAVLALAPAAAAQEVDACKVFTLEMARTVVGKAMTPGRNVKARSNAVCGFKDDSGYETFQFTLYRMATADEASRYLLAEIKTAQGVRGSAPEKVAGVGDEAYYLPGTWQLYVRKGANWFSFGYPDRKTPTIEMAKKIAAGL